MAAGKLAQALAYGARTLLVKGDFDACLRLVREASEALGIALLNSINPWRLEGQKTIVWEMLQQRGWEPPDWIVVPAGNLGNTSAFGKALREAHGLGLIRRVPRVASVQAAGASPFYRSFRGRLPPALPGAGGDRRHRDPHRRPGEPRPRGAHDPRDAGPRHRPSPTARSSRRRRSSTRPGSAASPPRRRRWPGRAGSSARASIRRGESVVAVLTGHVLKDPGVVMDFHSRPGRHRNPPVTIEARLSDGRAAPEAALRAGLP